MSAKDDSVYIRHISDSIERIEKYLKDIDEDEFARNTLIQDAVIRQLAIIGEAGKRIPHDLRKRHKDIPWKDVVGMRDKLIHDYFGVDLQAVWDTATIDIPELKKEVKKILKELSANKKDC